LNGLLFFLLLTSEPTPGGFLREYTPPSLERPSSVVRSPSGYALRLNIAWLPQLVQNMTYLLIDRYPCLKSDYGFDAAGFWMEYWPAAFRRRLSKNRNLLITEAFLSHFVLAPIPTKYYKHAILNHRDTTILMYFFLGGLILCLIVLIIFCGILFVRVRKETHQHKMKNQPTKLNRLKSNE